MTFPHLKNRKERKGLNNEHYFDYPCALLRSNFIYFIDCPFDIPCLLLLKCFIRNHFILSGQKQQIIYSHSCICVD